MNVKIGDKIGSSFNSWNKELNDAERRKYRISWIDSVRAFAVFCIVLGHTLRGEGIYYYLYTFHVPLCVMVSGICFSENKEIKELLINLIRRNLILYFAFSILSIGIFYLIILIIEGKSVILELPYYILGMLYGNGYLGNGEGRFYAMESAALVFTIFSCPVI